MIELPSMPARNGFHQVKRDPPAPRDSDAVPAGTCLRCGMVGPHPSFEDCIDALRSALAMQPEELRQMDRRKREA